MVMLVVSEQLPQQDQGQSTKQIVVVAAAAVFAVESSLPDH